MQAAPMSRANPLFVLSLGFASIMLLVVGLVMFAFLGMREMHEDVESVVQWHNSRISQVYNMRLAVRDRMIAMNKLVLIEDPFDRRDEYDTYLNLAGRFMAAREAVEGMTRDDAEKAQMQALRQLTGALTPLNDRVVEMALAGDVAKARGLLLQKALPAQQQVLAQIDQIVQHYQSVVASLEEQAHQAYLRIVRVTGILAFGVLALSVLIATLAIRRVRNDRQSLIEARETEDRLRHMVQHDPLSGLPNRLGMTEYMRQVIGEADRLNHQVAVMLLDLDGFKAVNDALGHAAGDQLLVSVAQRLTDSIHRESDIVARLAGDEFVVILGRLSSADEATMVARRILRALEMPHMVAGQKLAVSASIGLAVYPGDARTAAELLHCADSAMYAAKTSGKNAFRYYAPGMTVSGDR